MMCLVVEGTTVQEVLQSPPQVAKLCYNPSIMENEASRTQLGAQAHAECCCWVAVKELDLSSHNMDV